ncbi:hypothetical protein N8612_05900 [Verrucomicrobia bacterium]|nr:hypothetical protein [Verrucomicrobiota bacterium]
MRSRTSSFAGSRDSVIGRSLAKGHYAESSEINRLERLEGLSPHLDY